jgi:transcriptional antiterminator RfaH
LKNTDHLKQTTNSLAWFCVRTQAKHEHIAAASLKRNWKLEVFLPRIRFKRTTRQGPAWTTEALFINYLFSRFNLATHLRVVQSARGVAGVVHFGSHWPVIPDATIAELRTALGGQELHVIDTKFNPGDNVEIVGGTFHGLQAVVTRVIPSKQRVAVLLDFLGRQTSVELDDRQLVAEAPTRILKK